MSQQPADSEPPENETPAERLERLLFAPSSTPIEKMPRCPDCGSVKIHRRTRTPDRTQDPENVRWRSERWRCESCQHDFDDPDPPLAEVDDEEEASL